MIVCCLLAVVVTACAGTPDYFGQERVSRQRGSVPGVAADHIWVYGESALIGADAQGRLSLESSSAGRLYRVTPGRSDLVDQGLLLWQLRPGRYRLFWGDLPLRAGELFLPEGYTLPRQGKRLHWAFGSDQQGLLTLTVSLTEKLPEGWYDVIVDAGHGGSDVGAEGGGYLEADLDLDNALDLAELLREMGLEVALTREDRGVPGGVSAENNPYVRGARVELIYASHAPYLLSCHLNAKDGREEGFQIYGSVAASPNWSQAVADALRDAGALENDSGKGLLAHGVYQRGTEGVSSLRDHYFILRETGGYALSPARYLVYHRASPQTLCVGAQGLLLEFAFMDNPADLRRWLARRDAFLAATAAGCAAYWQL